MYQRISESFAITLASGEKVRGDIAYTGSPMGMAILYVHGLGSKRWGEKSLALAEACAQRGLCFASFDFRGHGDSDGSFRQLRGSRLLEDLAAVRHYLVGRGIRRIGLVGSSMGGWASAWFALHADEVHACYWIAPALRFHQRRWESLTPGEQQDWQQTGIRHYTSPWMNYSLEYGFAEEREQYRLETLLQRWQKPCRIVHGCRDDLVPIQDSLDFLQGVAGGDVQVRLIRTGDHRLNDYRESMAEEACQFLTEGS